MSEEHQKAANRVGELADEFSGEYDLANLIRAKSSKIMKLAQTYGTILKASSDQSGEHKQAGAE